MNETLFLIPGILLICLTVYDLLYTTFSPRGAGIVSAMVSTLLWRAFLRLSDALKARKVLGGAGIVIITAMVLSWILLLWMGHALVFFSDADAVVNSTTKVPASALDRVYYAGYSLSTLGNGDLMGGTEWWRIYTALISFSGLALITIAITYMVPILSAVTERRSLSIRIASMGDSPQQMLLNNWNGEDFKQLERHLSELAQPVAKQGQQHLAYPLLHYFYHEEVSVALLPSLVTLDEALTLLLLYVPEDRRPPRQSIAPLRQAISTFLESLNTILPDPDSSAVPELRIEQLQAANVPALQPTADRIEQLRKRRRLLYALITYVGWEWADISRGRFDADLDLREAQ